MKDVIFKILVIWLMLSGIVLNIGIAISIVHIYIIGN